MASEPAEEAIANFVSFTSTTREQAISFLKANNLDSQKAINAYFEDPTGPLIKTNQSSTPSFGFGQQDHGSRMPATAPPSRPPSRINMHDKMQALGNERPTGTTGQGATGTGTSGQGLTLAEREEQELQRAVAMSLNQDMGQQESGVTTANTAATTGQTQFTKATRDHYDEGDWAMTLFNTSSQEVVISPDPEDRKKANDEPAFIRPTQDNLYLGGFLTILHEIPLAREALLLRTKLLHDYGNDLQWWNGQPINLPKIVTVNESKGQDDDWEDVIHETQRLMAFLDSTDRAFGSCDALANLKSVTATSSDSEEVVARFLETLHGAAIRADPENPLATTFMSHAYKRSPFDEGDEPISKELFTFEPMVERNPDQNLYDVLDTAIWSDKPGENLDDVWLEHVGEVVVIKLDAFDNTAPVDVKTPAVFYPDRYMSSCREISRQFRTERLRVQEQLAKIENLIKQHTMPTTQKGNLTKSEIVDKGIESVHVALKSALEGKSKTMSVEEARGLSESLPRKLKALSRRMTAIHEALQHQKQKTMESLRGCSQMLTEPSQTPGEPPVHKYTLQGICTKPHVTYVLKSNSNSGGESDEMKVDGEKVDASQWWRISFSAEDGKARHAAKNEALGDKAGSQDADVVGYTATKVQEEEVLQAAGKDWRSVLLVYASNAAMNAPVDGAPPQLQGFVKKDNKAFAAECRQSATDKEDQAAQQQSTFQTDQQVKVSDYELPSYDSLHAPGQEMQEKSGSGLLGANTGNTAQAPGPWRPAESDDEMVDHIENAKPA